MKRVAVFCGSREGASREYVQGAEALGKELAKRNIGLVYGGASVGVMGAVADAVMEAGGEVIGVMPGFLNEREIAHPGLTELLIVDSMHTRKAKMTELADGFIALPGGPGTLEELFEIFTWGQLGLHRKPSGLLNINHYYDPLITLFNHMATERFMDDQHLKLIVTDTDPGGLLDQFSSYTPPAVVSHMTDEDQT